MGGVKQIGRTVLSFLPKVGVLPKPGAYRPNGISAMMTVKDEEDWVEKSIRSVLDAVDEIIVVDNASEDSTPRIIAGLEAELGGKVRAFSFPAEDYCSAVNFTLSKTRFRWILRWHGDFVARTTGPLGISGLSRRIAGLDSSRFFCVWIGPISLDGDLFHQIPQVEVELEPFVFSYSPSLHYRQIGRFEVLQVPWFYKRLEWRELYFFHMRYVKPARRILYRFFWTEWMAHPDKSRFPTLDSYVRNQIREVYSTSDLREAMIQRIRDLGRELVPYDKNRFGDYPVMISEELEHPKYRLLYRSGRVVSRSDLEEPARFD